PARQSCLRRFSPGAAEQSGSRLGTCHLAGRVNAADVAWRAAGRECDLAGRRPAGEISPACAFADPRLWSPWASGAQNLIPTRITYPAPPRPAGRGRAARPSRRQRPNAAAREPNPVWHPARERETQLEPKLEPAVRHFEWNEALEPTLYNQSGNFFYSNVVANYDHSLLLSPVLVASAVVGIVLLLSCASILAGSIIRERQARLQRQRRRRRHHSDNDDHHSDNDENQDFSESLPSKTLGHPSESHATWGQRGEAKGATALSGKVPRAQRKSNAMLSATPQGISGAEEGEAVGQRGPGYCSPVLTTGYKLFLQLAQKKRQKQLCMGRWGEQSQEAQASVWAKDLSVHSVWNWPNNFNCNPSYICGSNVEWPQALDFSYRGHRNGPVNHPLYPDMPPRYEDCLGSGAQIYIPTDDPPPYSLFDSDPLQSDSLNPITLQPGVLNPGALEAGHLNPANLPPVILNPATLESGSGPDGYGAEQGQRIPQVQIIPTEPPPPYELIFANPRSSLLPLPGPGPVSPRDSPICTQPRPREERE
ncbi:protein BEAN1, partial [Suncus etruscus]|uniref:protein BEAN1 n=1 Tax=Suncus etruscus TaxID=109475 RepID=UPI0021107667